MQKYFNMNMQLLLYYSNIKVTKLTITFKYSVNIVKYLPVNINSSCIW